MAFSYREQGPYLKIERKDRFLQVNSAAFADKVGAYFDRVHREVFAGDPAANPNMSVEVIGAAMAHDTPVLILIAPWTLCGVAMPPDGGLPTSLRVGHVNYPALANEVDEVGGYWSVVLVPDVSTYGSQEEARSAAQDLAEEFRIAVERVRREMTEVPDGDRRSLLKNVGGRSGPVVDLGTGFGRPDESSPQAPDG